MRWATPPEPGGERGEPQPDPARRRPWPRRRAATRLDDGAEIEGVVISPDAYSQGEVLRHREFDRMTPSELREAERLVDATLLAAPGAPANPPVGASWTSTVGIWRHGRCSARTSGPAGSS